MPPVTSVHSSGSSVLSVLRTTHHYTFGNTSKEGKEKPEVSD